MKRGDDGRLKLLVTKTTDDLLATGTKEAVKIFFEQMKERFSVRKAIV